MKKLIILGFLAMSFNSMAQYSQADRIGRELQLIRDLFGSNDINIHDSIHISVSLLPYLLRDIYELSDSLDSLKVQVGKCLVVDFNHLVAIDGNPLINDTSLSSQPADSETIEFTKVIGIFMNVNAEKIKVKSVYKVVHHIPDPNTPDEMYFIDMKKHKLPYKYVYIGEVELNK